MTMKEEVIRFLASFFLCEFREDATGVAECVSAAGIDVEACVRIATELSGDMS